MEGGFSNDFFSLQHSFELIYVAGQMNFLTIQRNSGRAKRNIPNTSIS